MPGLSKSKLMAGHQCPKRLYLEVYRPDLAEYSDEAQKLFSQGTMVGRTAWNDFPGGINIDEKFGLEAKLQATAEHLAGGVNTPLFESTFQYDGVLIKADILNPAGKELDLHEVKSSTSVKDYHLLDVAIQSYIIRQSGYPVNRTYLTHINNKFVYETENNYDGLFSHADITDQIDTSGVNIQDLINEAKTLLEGECPDIEVGSHCLTPYDCPFLTHCKTPTETLYPVTSLPRGGKIVEKLLADGILDISDIPDGVLTSPVHERVRQCVIDNETFISSDAGRVLQALPYPRYYLDFETIGFAVPIWLGTRPYQQLPFQWSCHIQHDDGSIEHREFLDVSGHAPMEALVDSLLETIGNDGTVLVYNATFEKRILNELAERFPDQSERIASIIDRIFDLWPFTKEHYYHRDMHGSWSLKAVLPTLGMNLDHSELETVQHGGDAQIAYLECVHPDTIAERKQELVNGLKMYCALDTLAMVKIVERLS